MSSPAAPIWTPSTERAAASRMAEFLAEVRQQGEPDLVNYSDLHGWSVRCPEKFWPMVAKFTGMQFRKSSSEVLTHAGQMPGARWFVGAELNFAENLLRFRDDRPAIIACDESGQRRQLSFAELYLEVEAAARGLRALGIEPGDRVAGFLPNQAEAVIAMLAAASLGAVWSSCSPDFGLQGVLDRFGQIAPKVIFTADGYRYGGKSFDSLSVAAGLAENISSVVQIVVVPVLEKSPGIHHLPKAVSWQAFQQSGSGAFDFASLPFDHPLYILFSSGTTGVPKCIVHGAGGTLLQHLKEHVLHTDLRREDRLFFYTTCGWMMWNWLVSALATGSTIVLYEGSPLHPDVGSLWRLAEQEKVTVFGTGAKYLAAVEKSGYRPGAVNSLDPLRSLLSTGSPLAPASYDFIYAHVKKDLQLASISGGTDLIGCFALGNPLAPVYRGEIQSLALGMAVEIFSEAGQSMPAGEKGELVCTRPFPTMPLGFWNDQTGRRYRSAYFDRFPGVWAHGDFAALTEHGGLIIYGRSDALLNPGGVRIGTAEIYRQVEKISAVLESLAIGQQWKGDTRVVLFVVLRDGLELDEDLRDRIRLIIRQNATPRHVPAKIIAVPAIPRTRSGKIVELAVRSVVHDEPVRNTDALANPEALDYFRQLPELQC
jgi:acetoacetyl-CoA synthetase